MDRSSKTGTSWSRNDKIAVTIFLAALVIWSGVWVLINLPLPSPCSRIPLSCPGREALNFSFFSLNSPTNVTVTITNTGLVSVTLSAYYVKDPNGPFYPNTNWTSPLIQPNSNVAVNFLIDGKTFYFQHGISYTITAVTSRNNQFNFTLSV